MVDLSHGLKAACAQRLAGLSIPRPFDLDAFCHTLSQHRGREISILPLSAPPSDEHPFGMWLPARDRDLLFLHKSTKGWHRDQIVAHEFGHMLWDDGDTAGDDILTRLFPGLAPAMVRVMLGWPPLTPARGPAAVARFTAGRHARLVERRAELTGTLLLAAAEHPMIDPAYAGTIAARVPAAWSADV